MRGPLLRSASSVSLVLEFIESFERNHRVIVCAEVISEAEFIGGSAIALRCNKTSINPNTIQPGDQDEVSIDWRSRCRRGGVRNSCPGAGQWRLLSRRTKIKRLITRSPKLISTPKLL